jgi:hypothetical protein
VDEVVPNYKIKVKGKKCEEASFSVQEKVAAAFEMTGTEYVISGEVGGRNSMQVNP